MSQVFKLSFYFFLFLHQEGGDPRKTTDISPRELDARLSLNPSAINWRQL